jgi:hypothetical protein
VITGTNFNPVASNNIVYFGAVKATVSAASINSLTVTVPNSASYGPVSVTTNGLTAYSESAFIVSFPGGEPITSNSFADKTDLTAGESPYDIASGDLDGDGKPDMVVVNGQYPYSISVYKNTSVAGSGIISFAEKDDIPTGIGPFGIDIGDIDSDGKLDVVITNTFSFTISVFRNNSTPGNISFEVRKDLPAMNPDLVTIADLNKDGRPDLVVTNFVAHSISIFRNTSNPGAVSFAARTDYPTGNFPDEVAVADIDGDSWKDIVVTSDAPIAIFKNAGTAGISFSINNNPIPGLEAGNVILADFDGDNKPELTVGKDASVAVYRNTSVAGTISFAAPNDFAISGYPGRLAVADLDGDGKPDLATLHGSVLANASTPGTISLEHKADFGMGSGPFDLTIDDFDGDNKPDMATANQNTNTVSLLRNQVDGPHIISFNPATETEGGTVTITGARFVNITEVSFGGVPAQSFSVVNSTTITAVVATGANGDVSVKGAKGRAKKSGFTFIIPTSSYPVPVITSFSPMSGPVGTTVTITGQHFDPLPANNIVYMGAARANILTASTTQLTIQVPTGATYEPITVTTHLLTGSSTHSFMCTFQTGPSFTLNSFAAPQLIEAYQEYGEKTPEIAIADIDGDGKTDLVFGGNSYKAARNTSTTTSISFATPQTILENHGGSAMEFADMDGDGKQDLVLVSNSGAGNGTFGVLKNQSSVGNISFTSGGFNPITFSSAVRGFAVKDLDVDGKPDIVYTDGPGNYMSICRNMAYNGAITFAPKVDVPTGVGPTTISSNDLNGDGKPELVVTNTWGNSISVFPNNSTPGSLSFGPAVTYAVNGTPVQTTLNDFDGDGKLDIAVVRNGGYDFRVYKNTGTGGSISFTYINTYNGYDFPTEIRSADMNGDGKPDVVLFSETMSAVSVFENVTTAAGIAFWHHNYYSTDGIYGEVEIGDFDGDGKTDMVVGAPRVGIGIIKNKVGTAKVVAAGANPVQGEIKQRMTLDATVQTYNGVPYVQRHYDIEPVNNPATSTATITLYFNQEEFNNFNAFPGHGADLPKNVNDFTGIANLRVYQYHGLSATSVPGSYTGVGTEINPDDVNIFWNAKAPCWEVTFNVTGFSGFFVSNGSFNSTAPPVISATGNTTVCPGGKVVLNSSAAAGNQWYKDGIMVVGANAATYEAAAGGVYTATVTANGFSSLTSNSIMVTVASVAAPVISSDGTNLSSSIATGNQWYKEGNAIAGATNKTYKPLEAGNYTVNATNNGCTTVLSAAYFFVPAPAITMDPNAVVCPGKVVTLTSSALNNNQWYKNDVKIDGATARTYQTNQAGDYTVTTSVNNVTSVQSPRAIVATGLAPAKPTITLSGGDLVSSVSQGNQWYENGVIIPGATDYKYKPTRNGNYSVVITAPGFLCTAESDKFSFTVTGIINIDDTHFVKLSPNPADGYVILNHNLAGSPVVHVQVLDISGRVYRRYNNLADGSELSTFGLAGGIYVVKIIDPKSRKTYIIKLMKR